MPPNAPRSDACGRRAGHRLEPLDERAGVQRAGLPGDFASLLENNQRRDASNAVAAGDVLGAFGIELSKSHPRLQLCCGALEVWRHGSALAAPRGPEVDHNRNLAAVDLRVEG